MKKKPFFIKILILTYLLVTGIEAKESVYLDKGIKLFNKKEYEKSKILFERDLVFDPKSEKSYLYLAKIFKNAENDEALYMLTLLKIKQSNYDKANELIEKFILVCKSFCSKKNEIEDKLKKLNPSNEQDKN